MKRSSSTLPDLLCCPLSYWYKHLCGYFMNRVWGLIWVEEKTCLIYYFRFLFSSPQQESTQTAALPWSGGGGEVGSRWVMQGRQASPGLLLAPVLACVGLRCTLTTGSVCRSVFCFIWLELSLKGEIPLQCCSQPGSSLRSGRMWLQGKLSVCWSDQCFSFCLFLVFKLVNWFHAASGCVFTRSDVRWGDGNVWQGWGRGCHFGSSLCSLLIKHQWNHI